MYALLKSGHFPKIYKVQLFCCRGNNNISQNHKEIFSKMLLKFKNILQTAK